MRCVGGEAGSRKSLCALALLGLSLLPLGGCAFGLPSLGGDGPDTTGALAAPTFRSPLTPLFDVEDWRRARAALGVAIDPQGNGASVAWSNPESGLKGSFVPVGQPFVQHDIVCRSFVATIEGSVETETLQGTACRPAPDEWEISGVKPWRKPA